MKHKYKLADIDCQFCESKGKIRCSVSLCPYIMGNLSDLFADIHFRGAVQNAEDCQTLHKNTLMRLKKQAEERNYNLFYRDTKPRCNYKPECDGCNYPATGFICHSRKDSTCMADWARGVYHAGC